MKILVYSQTFFPATGGVQTIVLELCRGLAAWCDGPTRNERFEVTVVTNSPGAPEQDSLLPFRVVRQPGFWELVRLLRATDLVHLAGPALVPLSVGLLLQKPVFVEHHGFQTICPNGQLLYELDQSPCPGYFMAGRYGECARCNAKTVGLMQSVRLLLLTPVRRWLCNQAYVNITPTNWLATVLSLKRSTTVLHGLSSGFASEPKAPSVLTFAFQGRLVSTKGVALLLEAFQQLCRERHDLRLKIIGSGPEEQSLRMEAARLSGRVEFLGQLPEADLDRALSDAATVVMPSLAGEVFGLVAAENMFRGKLLIVSDLGALREVVGETGFVFSVGDAHALAAAMRRAVGDPAQVARLGSLARARAMEVFGREGMIEAHASLYREALRFKGRAGEAS